MRGEDGILIVEVLMAMLVLSVGILAGLTTMNASNDLTLTTQREQAAMSIGEQSMEQLRADKYASLALSSVPTHTSDGNASGDTSGNPTNPDYWVSSANPGYFLVVTNFNQESSSTLSGVSSTGEQLISGGSISPGPTSVTSNGYTGSVYTFISWVNDKCLYLGVDLCPGTQDAKRITVAVELGSQRNLGVQKPVWLSTVVANPAG